MSKLFEAIEKSIKRENIELFLEKRIDSILSSIDHIFEQIDKTYPDDISEDLKNRFMLSLKNRDGKKFVKGLREIRNKKIKDSNDKSSK